MAYICGDCQQGLTFDSIEMLLQHYTRMHSHFAIVKCGQGGCLKSFLNKTSLFRHIKSCHHLTQQHGFVSRGESSHTIAPPGHAMPSGSADNNQEETGTGDSVEHMSVGDCDGESGGDNDNCVSDGDPPIDLNRVAARIVMELRSKASLTGKAIERFEEGCVKLLTSYRKEVISKISLQLKQNNLSDLVIENVLKDIPEVDHLFMNLKTIEDQLNVFSEEFGLVRPEEKFLWSRLDKRLDPKTNSFVQTQVNSSYQYISIIETLKAILSSKSRRDNIFKDLASEDGALRSYVDGYHCRDHPFLKKHENVIHIILFYDELEIANSLGSKTIIHKLGAFFFQVLNGPAEFCSSLSSIHLLILAYGEDLKKPGAFQKVLTPFILEMKKLSSDEGVKIALDGKPFVLRALLTAVTADTLAAHDILGFMASGAKHFCRVCMISRDELREDGNCVGESRTKENHDLQVQEVTYNPRASSQYGVKRSCALNQVPYFHCVESSVFDAFHDLLEGVVPLVVKLVLRQFIFKCKFLTIDEFNCRLESFSYGLPDSKNRPSPNFTMEMLITKKKLKQTGSQTWCLMRALPFLMADCKDRIQVNDQHMEIVFLLQDIMKIVFSFEVSQEDLDHLEELIFKHNDLFKSLFIDERVQLLPEGVVDEPLAEESSQTEENQDEIDNPHEEAEDIIDDPQEEAQDEGQDAPQAQARKRKKREPSKVYMINKLHHLKHYPDMMRKFGPAVRVWCAKFEGRLKIFRQHSAVCCNFKNVVKTMAQMFQLSNVLHEEEESHVEFQKSKSNTVTVDSMGGVSDLFINIGFDFSATFLTTNSVTVYGEEYRPGLFVRLSSVRHSPVFGLINEIYIHKLDVFFLVKPWKVLCLSAKYNCYRVAPDADSESAIVNVIHLANFRAIAPWTVSESNDIYISLRTGNF